MDKLKSKTLEIIRYTLFMFLPAWSWASAHVTIIVPVRHISLDKIVQGIERQLANQDIVVEVKNAQGDNMLLMSLLQQIKYAKTDLVVPVGIATAEMTLAYIKKTPVFAVAAHLPKQAPQLVGVFDDEVMCTSWIHNFHNCFPLAVVASASEKTIPEIEALKAYAVEHQLALHISIIQQLNELPLVLKAMPDNTKGILILKDHLAVAGVSLIAKEAQKRGIPVIASDQGSVMQGATVAVGINEEQFGEDAGMLIQKILADKAKNSIGYNHSEHLNLFFNEKRLSYQNILTKDKVCSLSMPCLEEAE